MNQAITCPNCSTHIDFKRCRNCAHYHPHYIEMGSGHFTKTVMGHCVHPRVKPRKEDDCCGHWNARVAIAN